MSRRRFPLALALLLLAPVAVDASAASLVLPLAPDSPRPLLIFNIQADDGTSTDHRQVRVEADSGFAEAETSGVLNPVADVMAMEFHFPAATFDLTIGAADQIPFHIRIAAVTERVENLQPPPHRLASFGLASPGEQTSSIDPVQRFERAGFVITLAPAGSTVALAQVGGADCDSTGSPGCVGGTFTGTVDAFELTRLEFLGGTATIRDTVFALGTDSLGIAWTVSVATQYAGELSPSQFAPLVFTPEPGTAAMLGLGLALLGLRHRRRDAGPQAPARSAGLPSPWKRSTHRAAA